MKLSFLFAFFFAHTSWACSLKRPLISLSSPISAILEEFDLLDDPKLKGISVFYPAKAKAKKYGGGLFLAEKELRKMKGSELFIDQSQELQNKLTRLKKEFTIVPTLGTPFEVHQKALKLIGPFLSQCEEKKVELELKVKMIDELIKKMPPFKKQLVFFLGEIRSLDKLPKLAIGNDGLVGFLIKQGKLPHLSEMRLNYFPWSQKWLKERKDPFFVGLSEGKEKAILKEGYINLYSKRALLPGLNQIYYLEKFAKLAQNSFHSIK